VDCEAVPGVVNLPHCEHLGHPPCRQSIPLGDRLTRVEESTTEDAEGQENSLRPPNMTAESAEVAENSSLKGPYLCVLCGECR